MYLPTQYYNDAKGKKCRIANTCYTYQKLSTATPSYSKRVIKDKFVEVSEDDTSKKIKFI